MSNICCLQNLAALPRIKKNNGAKKASLAAEFNEVRTCGRTPKKVDKTTSAARQRKSEAADRENVGLTSPLLKIGEVEPKKSPLQEMNLNTKGLKKRQRHEQGIEVASKRHVSDTKPHSASLAPIIDPFGIKTPFPREAMQLKALESFVPRLPKNPLKLSTDAIFAIGGCEILNRRSGKTPFRVESRTLSSGAALAAGVSRRSASLVLRDQATCLDLGPSLGSFHVG